MRGDSRGEGEESNVLEQGNMQSCYRDIPQRVNMAFPSKLQVCVGRYMVSVVENSILGSFF